MPASEYRSQFTVEAKDGVVMAMLESEIAKVNAKELHIRKI
jgi:hypothetical protein